MRKNWKKMMALGLALAMTVSMFSGCGSKDDGKTKDGKTKLVMALWDEEQNKVMKEMIKVYEEENPDVTVETQLTTWAEYWTKIEASITGGDAADIIWVNALKAVGYADSGVLMDITEAVADLDVENNFPKALVDGYTYDGKLYAVPKDFDTNGLFYNKELFDKAGVAYPTDDWTMEDLKAAAIELQAGLGDGEYPIAVGYNSGQTTFEGSIYANGGYILNEDKTETGWNDPKTVEAVQAWYEFVEEGISPTSEQMADTLPDTMFEGGKLAMLMSGNYMISTFEKNEVINGKFDVVRRPSFNGKKTDIINGLGYAINAATKNEEEAVKFLNWLGGEEAMRLQGQGGTVISARIDAQQYFAETRPELNLNIFTMDLDEARMLEPRVPYYSDLMTVQREVMAEVWAGNTTLDEGTNQIAEKWQAVLDEKNGK